MIKPSSRLALATTILGIAHCFGMALALAEDLSPEQLAFFESKIRPVLVKECYGCHSNKAGNVRGGLRLDTQALTHIGGSSGPAVVPGNPAESLLLNAMNHEDWEMPPNRKLSQGVLDDFRKWITMGAPDPRKTDFEPVKSSISPEDIDQAKSSFWAYQLPSEPKLPQVQKERWPRTEIDRFVLSRLEEDAMQPAEDAGPAELMRRLSFDLIGLPPSTEQIDDFVRGWEKDPEEALASVLDRLLDQPQFGERWGRHWLDVARYSESTGREVNMTYPHAWRYRDYVIDAFNKDKPFNEFIQEQLAGDLLPAGSDEEWAKHLIATTFLALGPKNVNEQNRLQFEMDLVDEQIDATTRVFLGMSVSCARCHDHKFDAIRQSDYYALAGIFGNMQTYFGNPPSEYGRFRTPQRRQTSSLIVLPVEDPNPFDKRYTKEELQELRSSIEDLQQGQVDSRRERFRQLNNNNGAEAENLIRMRLREANQMAQLSDKLAVVDSSGAPISYCMGVQEKGPPRDARLLVRGEIDQAADLIPRGIPEVLLQDSLELEPSESGRLQLARWLGSEQNSLAARVMVNRIWKHMLGRGIVASTENFGVTGTAPSHPELLDFLALQFIESNWSVKALVREIALSRVYRMSTSFNETNHRADPENALLWRAHPRRLDAESLRDAMLFTSGALDLQRPRGSEVAKAGYTQVRNGILGDPQEVARRTLETVAQEARQRFRQRRPGSYRPGAMFSGRGGPGRMTDSQGSILADAVRKASHQLDMEEARFRSVYLPIVRDEVPRALEVFDFADANSIVGERESSNTSNQALYMLNNPFVIAQSKVFAARVEQEAKSNSARIHRAFQLAYGRAPTRSEQEAAANFLRKSSASQAEDNALTPLEALCQGLFASAEFRFIN